MKHNDLLVLLEKAIRIAVSAHMGQVDKAGFPYILHPLRVMDNVDTIQQKIIAVLHDTLEDTAVTPEFLINEGFSHHTIISKIILLTRAPKALNQSYEKYIALISLDEDARKVKLADMRDNADLFRFHDLEEKHLKMIQKYHQAIKLLEPGVDERLTI